MPPNTAFAQSDHPLTLLAQVVLIYYTFRLYFVLRYAPAPLPQMVAVLGFAILSNLLGRVGRADWFWIANIVQYATWATVMYLAFRKVQKAPAPPPDHLGRFDQFLTHWQERLQWSVGILAVGIVVYAYCMTYYETQRATQSAVILSNAAVAKATREYARKQDVYQRERQQIITGVASVTAALPSLTAAVASVSAAQQSVAVKESRTTNRRADRPRPGRKPETIKTLPPPGQINRPVVAPDPARPEPKKPSWWKRAFGRRETGGDTAQYVRADTTGYY